MSKESGRSVLVISAHPDDEALGCAGTILKHQAAGDRVHWLIATGAYPPEWSEEVIERKAEEIEAASRLYQMQSVCHLDLPATRLDSIPLNALISAMQPYFETVAPEIAYVVNPRDVHTDHHAVFTAAWTLMKTFRAAGNGPRRILVFETLSSTDAAPPFDGRTFVPNAFCDITPWMETKLEAVALFTTEAQQEPLPRAASAVRALARFRGATIGVEYAEAFQLLRDVF